MGENQARNQDNEDEKYGGKGGFVDGVAASANESALLIHTTRCRRRV